MAAPEGLASGLRLAVSAAALGGVLGVVCALYQHTLRVTLEAIYASTSMPVLTRHIGGLSSPIFLPPLLTPLLLLGAVALARVVPSGSAPHFVAAVNGDTHVTARQSLATLAVSLLAILSGGSAGPEGPMLYIAGGLGGMVSFSGSGLVPGDCVLVAGCAVISAFFGDALSGVILVAEMPHLSARGPQRLHVLPAAFVASLVAVAAHMACAVVLDLEEPPRVPHVRLHPLHLLLSPLLGIVAGLVARIFVVARKSLDPLPVPRLARSVMCGVAVAAIAALVPESYLWGETRITTLSAAAAAPRGATRMAPFTALFTAIDAIDGSAAQPAPHSGLTWHAQLGRAPPRARALSALSTPNTTRTAAPAISARELRRGAPSLDPLPHGHRGAEPTLSRVGASAELAAAKFLAILLTTTSGYAAGLIFPLFIVGQAIGAAIAASLPSALAGHHAASLAAGPCGGVLALALGSAVLAGVLRTPYGAALLTLHLVRRRDPLLFLVLLLTNKVALALNPLSLLNQQDDVSGTVGVYEWLRRLARLTSGGRVDAVGAEPSTTQRLTHPNVESDESGSDRSEHCPEQPPTAEHAKVHAAELEGAMSRVC